MNARFALTLASFSIAAAACVLTLGRPAAADSTILIDACTAALPLAVGDEDAKKEETKFSYIGSDRCKMCHMAVYRSWSKSSLAHAMDTLRPGHAEEAKKKMKFDPAKDYSRDEECVKCHTTGYGEPGGYAIPDLKDPKAVQRMKRLEGIGCESCHGPGSEYINVFMDIFGKNRTYKIEELRKAGLKEITEASCTSCHNAEAPSFDKSKPFDFKKMVKESMHERQKITRRAQ